MSETPDEIIATAMLLGAEFECSTPPPRGLAPGWWRSRGSTGWYPRKEDAALAHCKRHGFEANFNGDLYNTKEK